MFLGFLLGFTIALFIGWFGREIIQSIRDIRAKLADKPQPGVTNTGIPARPYQSTSSIIEPKTPQQLQTELNERLKRGEWG
jgi:hypothetical protein